MAIFPDRPQQTPLEDLTAPSRTAPPEDKAKWVDQICRQSRTFLESQRAYDDIGIGRDKIEGPLSAPVPGTLSKIRVNRSKRQIREIVETLAYLDLGLSFATDNKDLYRENQTLDIMAKAWWKNAFADLALKEGLQYAAVECIGYLVLDWDADFWNPGRGEIVMKAKGPLEVLPFELEDINDLQSAYAVTILKQIPTSAAKALWPKYAADIVPDAAPDSLLDKGRKFVQKFSSPILQRFGVGSNEPDRSKGAWPMTTLRYTFIKDASVNRSGETVKMGTPGSTWEYEVPSVGKRTVHAGYDREGNETFREATERDAMLYPFRRLIITPTSGAVTLFDGSSPHWHGMVPAAPIYFDKWPWDYLPFSLLREVFSIDEDNNQVLRVINDNMRTRLRPPLAYDDQQIDEATIRRFDTRAEGQRYGYNFMGGDMIKPILPPQFWDMPPWIGQHIKDNEQRQDYLIGTMDFGALSRLGQMPSGETIEDLMKAIGPLVNGMVASMSRTLRQVGEIWKGLALQHYTKPRRVQILSIDHDRALADSQEKERRDSRSFYDYDPLHLIPSHMPWEHRLDPETKAPAPSRYSLAERARHFINAFFFYVQDGTRHMIHQMAEKLLYQTLWRAGFPLDPWTMAEMFNIKNFGPPPNGTTTVFERWEAFNRIKNEQAVEAAATQMQLQAQIQAAMGQSVNPGAGGEGGPPGQGSGQPGQSGAGRPPTGQEAPKLEQKGDGRSVVSESG